jgi:hypothetical protein
MQEGEQEKQYDKAGRVTHMGSFSARRSRLAGTASIGDR